MKALEKGMLVATKGATVLGAGVAVAGGKLLELGSDAEESANAFQVTFKEAEKSLGSFVDDFANKAGFTSSELQQLLSFTGGGQMQWEQQLRNQQSFQRLLHLLVEI